MTDQAVAQTGHAPASRPPALDGIRVLEVAGGVGVAYAAKLFADLGADVIRADGPGDVIGDRPHELHRWLHTNKRSSPAIGTLASNADVILHDRGPSRAASEGLSYADLAAANPSVVVCSLTPFGMTGPYADYAAEEITIIHASSWGFLSPSASTRIDLPPLKAPGHHATINVATIAATAALAAVRRAMRTGQGAHVDFSMFAAAAKLTETAPVSASYQGVDASRLGVKIVVPWNMYRCADGFVQIICPEQQQWRSLVRLMGDPEWALLDVFDSPESRRENVDVLDLYLGEWLAEQRVADLCRDAQTAHVCISPLNTIGQLDTDRHFRARAFIAQSPDGTRMPGPAFRTDPPWWGLHRDAPSTNDVDGDGDGDGWRERVDAVHVGRDRWPARDARSGAALARPLEGVRVCDFSWIWAGPFCTQLLAHLGADVIKLESPDHLCLFRRLPYAPTGQPLNADTGGVFHLYNSDKRSVGIDLGDAAARDVIARLVAISDVVVDNFGVGTMARLGYGPDDLRRMNPDVIVASLSGYGQTGPHAEFMAYGPVGGAVAGLYAANGYEDGEPTETGIAIGDPGTGIAAAWAVVAALMASERTGEVATIDVAMVEAVAATTGELWMEHRSTGFVPARLANRDHVWSPHNCYPSLGEDRWVTIACPTEHSWRALCDVVDPSLAVDPRFATAADRKRHEDELDIILSAWTAMRDRWDTTMLLQRAGVAAFPSLSPRDLWDGDAQLEAIGMLERPEHAAVGRRVVPGVPWRMTPGPNGLRCAAPVLGQHTVEVLTELLGYSTDDVQRLVAAGTVRLATTHG